MPTRIDTTMYWLRSKQNFIHYWWNFKIVQLLWLAGSYMLNIHIIMKQQFHL